MDFVVRPGKASDSEEIAQVHIRTWQEAYAGMVDADFLAGMSPEPRARRWAAALALPEGERAGIIHVATDSGQAIIGFGALLPYPGQTAQAELRTLYVRQLWWGRGVGRALLTVLLERAAVRGIRAIDLWVLEENTRARRFYERSGFRWDGGRQREEMSPGIVLDEVRYGLELFGTDQAGGRRSGPPFLEGDVS